MKTGLQLRVTQNLVLAPQLQQAIRLLLLSATELQQEVYEMLESNPFLDEIHNSNIEDDHNHQVSETQLKEHPPTERNTNTEQNTKNEEPNPLEWSREDYSHDDSRASSPYDTSDWGNTKTVKNQQYSNSDDEEGDIYDSYSESISLSQHLEQQARVLRASDEEIAALMILIRSLDDNGYLDSSIEDIAGMLYSSQKETPDDDVQLERLIDNLSRALLLLQSFDPPGVGARSLAECLVIQLKQLEKNAVAELAIELCKNHLDDLARRDYRKIASHTPHTESSIREAFQLIQTLDPKPGRQYATDSSATITPDIIVQNSSSGWQAVLNPSVIPQLQVNEIYAKAFQQHKIQDGTEALHQRLQEARWFIKNTQQRFETISRVSQAIVDRQQNFFTHGELGMQPLVLREIAEELGLHESTISRVTTAKYMQTPFGVYELKFFFGSGVATESGTNASSTAVRAHIKKLIAEENPKKPLSDNTISTLLAKQGIHVARRTVAKYRDELQIPTATLRKAI